MTTTDSAIDASHLRVTLDDHTIIDDVSFSVPVGQTTAIIGPNGAGKSVLLKSLLGLIPLAAGRVTFWGTDHRQWRAIAPRVAYIPQSIEIDHAFPLTVRGLFALKSPSFIGLSEARVERMQELLAMVGMAESDQALLHTLSGGQLQRVMLAYSLLNEPELLVLDEPSAGIDAQGQENIYALLERIQQEEQLTLLLVSHELDIVMRYSEQVLCLNKKLVCSGAPHEVLSNEVLREMYGGPIGHFHHSHAEK